MESLGQFSDDNFKRKHNKIFVHNQATFVRNILFDFYAILNYILCLILKKGHFANKQVEQINFERLVFVVQNFFSALASVVHLFLTLYMYVVIARAVMSWFNPNPYNNMVRFIYQVTDPVLDRVRRWIPPISGLDLSPVIVIFAILFIDRFLVSVLRNLAR